MNTSITTTFKNYVNNGGTLHYRAKIACTDSNKTTMSLGDDDFLQDSWEFQYDSCEGDFAIGGAVPSQFKCTLNNMTNRFSNYISIMDGGLITVYLQSVTEKETYDEKTCVVKKTFEKDEEFCWGTYVINVDFQNYETIELKCYDRLYLLQQADLYTYLNSLDDSKKLTSTATSISGIFAKLQVWLKDFGINSLSRSAGISSLYGYFRLPKEFYASTVSSTVYYPRQSLSSTLTEYTSKYDISAEFADSDLWKGKTLLDFVRCYAQVLGAFCYVDASDNLHIQAYADKTDISATINTDAITDLTFAPKEYTTALRQCCVETVDTRIPVKRIPQVLTNGHSTYKYYPYFTSSAALRGPVSTGGYQLINHYTTSKNFLTIKDNPLVTYPLGDLNWRMRTVEQANPMRAYVINYYHIGGDLYFRAYSHNILNSSNETSPRYVGAEQIVGNFYSSDGKGSDTMDNKCVRDFSCSCKPQLGFRVGQMLKVVYKSATRTTTFSSLLNHIVFKPNVSMTLSTTYDDSNVSYVSEGLCCYNSSVSANSFQQFYEKAADELDECFKSVAGNQTPNITYTFTKYKEDGTAGTVSYSETQTLFRLYNQIFGEMLGSYTLKMTASDSTISVKPVKSS